MEANANLVQPQRNGNHQTNEFPRIISKNYLNGNRVMTTTNARPRSLNEYFDEVQSEEATTIAFETSGLEVSASEYRLQPTIEGRSQATLSYPRTPEVDASLCQMLCFPQAAFKGQLSRETEADVLNELLSRDRTIAKATQRLPETLKLNVVDDRPIGLLPGGLNAISVGDFIGAVRDAARAYRIDLDRAVVRGIAQEAGELDVSATFDGFDAEPRVGDIVSFGVRLRHSAAGRFPSQVQHAAYRLVCSNGVVSPVCDDTSRRMRIRRGGVGSAATTLQRIADTTRHAFEGLRDRMTAMERLATEPIDLRRAIEQVVLSQRWSRSVAAELLAALERGEHAEDTAFGLVNLLSYVGTHGARRGEKRLPSSVRGRLNLVAGVYAGQPVHQCKECHRILSPGRN